MKRPGMIRIGIVPLLAAVLFLFAPSAQLHADTIDDIAWVLDEMGPANPYASQGLNGDTLRSSRELLECVGNGTDVLLCVQEHQDTPIGETLTQGGVPGWFWDFLDMYAAFQEPDYRGVISHLGTAAVCIVSQVMAGGVDICALVEEIIELAKGMLNAANAVYEWAKEFGGAVLGAIGGAYCDVVGYGCDEKPDTPPEIIVYNFVFHAMLKEGVSAKEAIDANAFDAYVTSLKKKALHKPLPIVNYPISDAYLKLFAGSFTTASVETAAKIYENNVKVQWSQEILASTVNARLQSMSAYDNPGNYNLLSQLALKNYSPSAAAWDAKKPILDRCTQQFKTEFGYEHIDRWKNVTGLSQEITALRADIPYNVELCSQFYERNRDAFAERAKAYVVSQGYARNSASGQLACSSVDNFRNCRKLLSPFEQEESCKVTLRAAQEVLAEITEKFKNAGSSFYGPQALGFQPSNGTGIAGMGSSKTKLVQDMDMILTKPLKFISYRPTHEYYFNSYYTPYKDLPQTLVQSVMQIDPEYLKLMLDVQNAVKSVNAGKASPLLGIVDPERDPLVVMAASVSAFEALKAADEDFGFAPPSAQKGFAFSSSSLFPGTIDGHNTPVIYYDATGGNTELLFKKKALQQKPQISGEISKPINEKRLSGGVIRESLSAPSVQGKETAATTPMSTTLPSGQLPKSGPKVAANMEHPSSFALKENGAALSGTKQVKIGSRSTSWGRTVTLSDKDAHSKAGGTCRFAVEYTLQNRGKESTGMFSSRWENSAIKGAQDKRAKTLSAGASQKERDLIDLKPGKNVITLTLDPQRRVNDSNRKDKRYELRVNLTGDCASDERKKRFRNSESSVEKENLPLEKTQVLPLHR